MYHYCEFNFATTSSIHVTTSSQILVEEIYNYKIPMVPLGRFVTEKRILVTYTSQRSEWIARSLRIWQSVGDEKSSFGNSRQETTPPKTCHQYYENNHKKTDSAPPFWHQRYRLQHFSQLTSIKRLSLQVFQIIVSVHSSL